MSHKPTVLISACLAGLCTRYDGGCFDYPALRSLVERGKAIPFCPECEGGLPTPRIPCERVGEKVLRQDGVDCTEPYMSGARKALALCREKGLSTAILKESSPSCGVNRIYDGTFSGKKIPGQGVTAQLLAENGIRLFTEKEDINEVLKMSDIPQEKMGRQLVWHDEFNGDCLDTEKWGFFRSMNYPNREYRNDAPYVEMVNHQLRMRVLPSELPDCNYALPEGLCTNHTMLFRHGYVEMRAKMPYRHGCWPSFWMQTRTPFAKSHYMAETDIIEVFGEPRRFISTIHKWGSGTCTSYPWGAFDRPEGYYVFPGEGDTNEEFHVYGYEWTPEKARFFIDDVCYFEASLEEGIGEFSTTEKLMGMDGFHDFAYLIMNNEIFTGDRHGLELTEDDPLPIDYYIDYVRLYQNPETEQLILKDAIAREEAKKK